MIQGPRGQQGRRGLFIGAVLAMLLGSGAGNAKDGSSLAAIRSDPVKAAKAFFSAWQRKSRKAALRVATVEAVDKLLETRWRSMAFEGCNPRDEGGFQCVYRQPNDELSIAMEVDGGVSVGGYNVVSVSFSTEE